jgi:NADH-quinone oxidoreductase subunit L
MKAFWVNRVGDAFLILGMVGLFCALGTLSYGEMFTKNLADSDGLIWPLLFVVLGGMTKSAQIGFHVWLPDAMEGPTPVSALLHSATMVTAGAFLLIRLNPLLQHFPELHTLIVIVGVLTSLLAGSVAIAQTNLKRIIAYSTCSQLGFMFIAIGISAYGLALFHLITHAFFKSLLFLGAGIVSEKCDHEQDITKMGGLWRRLPITHLLMLLGVLALVGAPLFSGSISKDLILEASWAYPVHAWLGWFAYGGGIVAVALTGIYAWRLMILVFYGRDEGADKGPSEPDLWAMWVPMVPLAVGALALGSILKPWFIGKGTLWQGVINFDDLSERLASAHQVPWVVWAIMVVVGCAAVIAFVVFGWLRLNGAWMQTKLGRFLYGQAFFNELYQRLFVRPLFWVSGAVDDNVIDLFGPGMLVRLVKRLNRCVCWLQSGYVYRYALFMVLGGFMMVIASLFCIGGK